MKSEKPAATAPCTNLTGKHSYGGCANAEEAQAAFTRREFACKNSLVLREARESRFWLKLIAVSGLADGHADTVSPLVAETDELVAIYTTIVRKLKNEST